MDEPSSPETARAPSPAQSDATEVPDFPQGLPQGPRTLRDDIEHIKVLISRSTTSSRPPESAITAQVFRSRSGSTGSNGQVSQQRLFHELDLLKKRIKHEQHHVRRPSQIDPETESESEDVIDEREEELENIREQLVEERQHSEDLLAAAEVRIDSLSEEKTELSDLLEANRAELGKLQELKAEVDDALAKSHRKISELEDKTKASAEDVQRLIEEHKSREAQSEQRYRELQGQHDKVEQEAHVSQARVKELEETANHLEKTKSQVEILTKERDEHKAYYDAQQGQSTVNLEDLTTRLTVEQVENESLREQLKTKEGLHQEQINSAEGRIAQMEEAIKEFERRTANAEASLKSKEEELSSELVVKESEIAEIQRELAELHKKLYDQSTELEGKNAELSKAIDTAKKNDPTEALQAELAMAREACAVANRRCEAAHAEKDELVKELQEGWSSEAEQAKRAHHAELSSAQDNFQKELAQLSTNSERRIVLMNDDNANDIAKLKEDFQSEIAALKKSHKKELSRAHAEAEKDLATALSNADDDLDERLKAQSKAHRKELDKLHESLNVELTQLHVQLEEASQLRKTQMEDLQTEHRKELADLAGKLQVAGKASAALQSRLDAESTGRAEVERSLAGLKKQRLEEDKAHSETKEGLQHQIDSLEAEKISLMRQVENNVGLSTPDLQSRDRESFVSLDNSENVSVLKEKLVATEQERDEARASIDEKLDEVARQNEFLVKELETLMAQRIKEQTPPNEQSNASVQTEPVTIADDKIDPRALYESKADIATSKAVKKQSSPKHIDGLADTDEKRKSFEDYLKQAQAELSYLGVDLSANEEFFTGKIQEHLTELHAAKEDLYAEYQAKFGALYAEKERMERAVSAKNAAEFTKARGQLLASYGIHDEDRGKQAAMLANLPARKKKAIWSTEATLVSEYNRRVTKRRSQIAVKHAEKFHLLTQEYNRRTAGLVTGKDKRESDTSTSVDGARRSESNLELKTSASKGHQSTSLQDGIQPDRPHNGTDTSELEDALKAAADTTPRSRLPKRISISKPRTPTSIPRAVPYPGDWTYVEPASRSQKANPAADVPTVSVDSGRVASEPVTPDIVDAFRRLSIEPNDSEKETRPNTLPKRSVQMLPERTRPRMMRHSSRAIFGLQETGQS